MSFDLYSEETGNRLAGLRPVKEPEPGMFDNFLAGSGKVAMQTFAKAGRATSMAIAPAAIGLDKAKAAFNDTAQSTEIQDKFFKAHDEIFGRAVDYWTPNPNEVGAAGQIVGQLMATLPMVVANAPATVASTQLSTGEDLVRKGVDSGKAQAVGAVQAGGLGLGIWVPILGKTLAQRVLLGGAGFNATQGLATRAASGKLLEGTPGAEDYKAFDPTALTLDVLLGAAFGGIAHINPRMRAEGDKWHAKLAEWGKTLKPSEVDALATLRQAQHLNADSLPGKPVDVQDVNAHVDRMRQALDDLANDRPVQVEDMPAGRFEHDAARADEANAIIGGWMKETEGERAAIEAARIEASARQAQSAEPETPTIADQPNQGAAPDGGGEARQAAAARPDAGTQEAGLDPLAASAARFAAENPDLPIVIGKNADGSDITTTPRQWLEDADATMRQAQEDANLFEIAAGCLLGGVR